MTEATDNRCTYQPGTLRCIRQHHPDDPDAHVRQSYVVDEIEGGDQ